MIAWACERKHILEIEARFARPLELLRIFVTRLHVWREFFLAVRGNVT